MKMNSNRCSELLALVLVAMVALAAVPGAAAISTDAENVPDRAQVGEKVSATFTLSDLYTEYEEWTLNGETELENVTWTVTRYDQGNNKISQEEYDGESFDEIISLDNNVDRVSVRVTGTVPAVEEYSYEPAQAFTLATLSQDRQGGDSDEIETWEVAHDTNESIEAREELDSAAATIAAAKDGGASVSDAESTFDNAVSAYEGENFDNAANLANKAEDKAESAHRNRQLMFAGAGILGLAVVGGAFFWWRSQRDTYDKLG